MSKNQKTPLLKKASFWTLAAGIAIGGLATAELKTDFIATTAMAAPQAQNAKLASTMSAESMTALRELDSASTALAAAVRPSVVQISVSRAGKPGDMFGQPAVQGSGSGVIYRTDGYILTNDHVVDGMDTINVSLSDGRKFPAKIVGTYPAGDIAVIKIAANDLPALPLANSDAVRTGQMVMAVGSPFGIGESVTFGHVSALDRSQTINDPMNANGGRFYPDLIQTDASINPGNSGGALVNINGQVVGINTAIASQSGGSVGVGFAIPSNQAHLIADMLISKGKVTRAGMGLDPQPLTQYQQSQLGISEGAYVNQVVPTSGADQGGLRVGDVITRIGSTPINTYMDLRDAMYQYAPGEKVQVQYWRNGKMHTTTIQLETSQAIQQEEMNYLRKTQPQMQPQQPQMQQSPFPQGWNPFQDFGFPGQPRRQGQTAPDNSPHTGAVHLGAEVAPINGQTQQQFHIPSGAEGVVVVAVTPGSVAERLGLQPGDVITSLNGTTLSSPEQLVGMIQKLHWGSSASITWKSWPGQGQQTMESQTFTF